MRGRVIPVMVLLMVIVHLALPTRLARPQLHFWPATTRQQRVSMLVSMHLFFSCLGLVLSPDSSLLPRVPVPLFQDHGADKHGKGKDGKGKDGKGALKMSFLQVGLNLLFEG